MSFERRKVRIGRVVSDKMDRTCVVVVEWRRPHRLYKKSVKMRTRFKVHDPQNECRLGDQIRIVETRPLSKTKRWRVEEILQREEIAEIQPEEIKVEDESVLVYQPQHPAADEVADEGAVSEEAAEEEAPVDEAEPEATGEEAPAEAEVEAPVDEAEASKQESPEEEASGGEEKDR